MSFVTQAPIARRVASVFFSSRRRHTRFKCDWSSDVCSSDLEKYRHESEALPGLFHILDTFYGKLKLAVCTGAQREFMEIVVDRLKIREKFALLQASDEIKQGKPDPEIYLTTCAKLRLEPGQCIVLEDSSNGALAGKRAGCYTIGVPSDYSRGQDFSFVHFIASGLFAAERHISG